MRVESWNLLWKAWRVYPFDDRLDRKVNQFDTPWDDVVCPKIWAVILNIKGIIEWFSKGGRVDRLRNLR
jgi:hypothetical protein